MVPITPSLTSREANISEAGFYIPTAELSETKIDTPLSKTVNLPINSLILYQLPSLEQNRIQRSTKSDLNAAANGLFVFSAGQGLVTAIVPNPLTPVVGGASLVLGGLLKGASVLVN